jgi:glutaredoxin-related protein
MPQIFIGGKLIGGSDIALELFESGELQALASNATADE